ncbi:MAG: nucleotidyltransferase domain-containing protein [Candidatus Pacearchaeota archaeon]
MVSKNKKKSDKKKNVSKQNNPIKKTSIDLRSDRDIAMDFAVKLYEKFNNLVKSVILFGSSTKNSAISSSDIDIIIVIDDASVQWDQELIAWYREELGKLVVANPYKKELHITTTKITSWWNDMLKGDPVIINILRYGEALVDSGGFFNPLKSLLIQGRIKSTNEAIYNALQRAPEHFIRSKFSILNSVDGLFWAMVDSSQAALMSVGILPPSYEQIPLNLKEQFVDTNKIKIKYVVWFRDLYILHRKIVHGETTEIKGSEIEEWQERTKEFIRVMAKLVDDIVSQQKDNEKK